MSDSVKLGIIGIGNIGSSHCGLMLQGDCPGLTLIAVADRSAARREWAKEKLPDVTVFKDGLELIHSGLIDAVLIAVPHYQHPTLAIEAFQAGLNVLVEKPAGVYTLQVRDMMAEAARHPKQAFAMMFNQRTNCLYRKMKEMIDSGEVGELKRVNWIITDWYRTQYYYDSGAWRATWAGEGGGVLLNQCPHNLDLLQWLCSMPSRVSATCHEGKWHDIEVEDDVTAYLEYPNGATGTFITTTGDAPGTNRLEVTGTLGKLVCENGKLTFTHLKTDEREWCKTSLLAFGRPEEETYEIETDGLNEQHAGVLKAFAQNILTGAPLVANGKEGIHGLMLSNAMHLSSWQQKPVDLPIDEELFLVELNKRRATSKHKEEGESIVSDTAASFAKP